MTENTWLDTNGKKLSFYKWGSDQPENMNGNEDCILAKFKGDYMWNDMSCSWPGEAKLGWTSYACQYGK